MADTIRMLRATVRGVHENEQLLARRLGWLPPLVQPQNSTGYEKTVRRLYREAGPRDVTYCALVESEESHEHEEGVVFDHTISPVGRPFGSKEVKLVTSTILLSNYADSMGFMTVG